METREGFEFSIFDGDITGRNIKLVENELLVQEWYFGDRPEESMVTIILTLISRAQRLLSNTPNVPDEDREELEEGWRIYYWGAIKEFFK